MLMRNNGRRLNLSVLLGSSVSWFLLVETSCQNSVSVNIISRQVGICNESLLDFLGSPVVIFSTLHAGYGFSPWPRTNMP